MINPPVLKLVDYLHAHADKSLHNNYLSSSAAMIVVFKLIARKPKAWYIWNCCHGGRYDIIYTRSYMYIQYVM